MDSQCRGTLSQRGRAESGTIAVRWLRVWDLFAHYRTIESLAEVVFVSQEEVAVERYSRQPDGSWLLRECNRPEDRLPLPAIGCELPVAEVYERVSDEPA